MLNSFQIPCYYNYHCLKLRKALEGISKEKNNAATELLLSAIPTLKDVKGTFVIELQRHTWRGMIIDFEFLN